MAGSGRRIFQPGEVLTASNVMNYLQDQAVMNFAGTAARGSAIGTAVSEGMVTYRADDDVIEVYDGSVWKKVYPSVANVGEVVQVVSAEELALVSVASSTPTNALSVSITPTSATNKILVIANINLGHTATNVDQAAFARLERDTTVILYGNASGSRTRAATQTIFNSSGTSSGIMPQGTTLTVLDSPGSTSAISYNVKIWASAGTARLNRVGDGTDNSSRGSLASTITVMEIVA